MNGTQFQRTVASLVLALVTGTTTAPAIAAPVPLTDIAATIVGGVSDDLGTDGFAIDAPPENLPIAAEALVDQASAFASADTGTLAVDIEVLGRADADATSSLDATFATPAALTREFQLQLDFDYTGFTGVGADFDLVTDLVAAILVDGAEVASLNLEFGPVPVMEQWVERFRIPAGAIGDLSLTLSAALSGFDLGVAGGVLGLLDFQVEAIPLRVSEPTAGPLALLGLASLLISGVGRVRGDGARSAT